MESALVVTGSDEKYFPLVVELLTSIRAQDHWVDVGVIDAGMTSAQKEELQAVYGCIVRSFKPESERLKMAIAKRPALAVNLGKLWLDVLFPEFETLIFLDADTWVQDWKAIDWLAGGASKNALAIVPTWNRYRNRFPIYWLFGLLPIFRSFNVKAAFHAYLPWSAMRSIGDRADLNAGVYALRRDAPHWERMRQWQHVILKRGRPFTSDGLAMALACHFDGCKVQLMPEFCNYLGEFLYDQQRHALVDFFHPHDPVGVVHFANHKKIRFDKNYESNVVCLNGHIQKINVRFGEGNFNVCHTKEPLHNIMIPCSF